MSAPTPPPREAEEEARIKLSEWFHELTVSNRAANMPADFNMQGLLVAKLAPLLERLKGAEICWTCGGGPPATTRVCVCEGTGSHVREVQGLREAALDVDKQVATLQREREEAIGKWQGAEACILARDHTIGVLSAASQKVEEERDRLRGAFQKAASALQVELNREARMCAADMIHDHPKLRNLREAISILEAALTEEPAGKERCQHTAYWPTTARRCCRCRALLEIEPGDPSPAPGAKEESE